MSYPNVSHKSPPSAQEGLKMHEDKVAEIKKFIDENHRNQYGDITNELHEVIESLGYEYFGE